MVDTSRRERRMAGTAIGTREEWLAAREGHARAGEGAHEAGDEIAQLRRDLPWCGWRSLSIRHDDGEKSLPELFDGRSQLLVYHFMFGPSYEAGCPVNSSIADSIDGVVPHCTLATRRSFSSHRHRSRSSRATSAAWAGASVGLGLAERLQLRPRLLADLEQSREAVAQRPLRPGAAGASRRSSTATPARRAPTSPATSPRARGSARSSGTDDDVYHAYSTTWRGLEFLMTYYPILDHAPEGRGEGEGLAALDPPARRVRERVMFAGPRLR
jgi:predicted dithiol-disulfide oxidoreductase (DUF899 family)